MIPIRALALAGAAAFGCDLALAADPPPATQTDQVVVPQVDRRGIRLPKFPSNDFEFGLFGGSYATQNFGTSFVGGLRLGYHITEDFFVEGVYAQTNVSDKEFRRILPGGIFATEREKLTYYNLSVGYNVLPGEVFFGKSIAKASAFYLIGGVGSTKFVDQKKQTINFGFGTRLLFNDHFAVQVDVRDHIFSFDLLGTKRDAKNLEATFGLTVYF